MTRAGALTEIPLRFYSFHVRFSLAASAGARPGRARRARARRGGKTAGFNRAVEIVELAVRAPAYYTLMRTPRAAVSIDQVPPLRDRDLECNPLEVGGDEAHRPRSDPSRLPAA
eukprot:COSAG01_NODE_13961_length_1513_cov_133.034653_3_plen_113_part_01